jgi:hypothetical protein
MNISREELKEKGWKTVGLKEMSQQILEKDGRQIVWNAETKEIVEGELDE